MARRREDALVVEAAILAADGWDQAAVAGALALTQGAVSKRLAKARKLGYLEDPKTAPRLCRERIAPELLAAAEDKVTWRALRARLFAVLARKGGAHSLTELTIIRSPTRRRDPASWLDCLRRVAAAAARRIRTRMQDDLRIGVTWGYTLRFVVEELKKLGLDRPYHVRCFPTVGAFPFLAHTYPAYLTSTAVAWDLGDLLEGISSEAKVNLDVVPAYLSAEFAAERDTLVRFFSTFPAVREVFGDPGSGETALLDAADMIVTGMGDMPSESGQGSPSLKARLALEALDMATLSRIAVGDLGGILLPRPGIDQKGRRLLTEINGRFMGPSLSRLQSCVSRGASAGKPGVVAIAHGAPKAEAALEAIRLRAVNELIVDDDLAFAMVSAAEKDSL